MGRVLLSGVLGAALVAAVGVFGGCGDDDDGATGSMTPTASSVLVVTPTGTPADDPNAVIDYSLKVVDWGERLRVASLTIAEKVGQYGQDITRTGDLVARNEMFAAFDSIGEVRAERNATTPPPSLAADHEKLGESLAAFADARQSVTLAYAAWDAGQTEATQLQFGDAADSMNKATTLLNQVIAHITDPNRQ